MVQLSEGITLYHFPCVVLNETICSSKQSSHLMADPFLKAGVN